MCGYDESSVHFSIDDTVIASTYSIAAIKNRPSPHPKSYNTSSFVNLNASRANFWALMSVGLKGARLFSGRPVEEREEAKRGGGDGSREGGEVWSDIDEFEIVCDSLKEDIVCNAILRWRNLYNE